MKWNYAGAGGGTILHVPICVPGSFLHVAPGTAMPSKSGLHASRAMELGVQIRPLIRPANLSCVPCFPVSLARVPGVQGIDCPAAPAVQHAAPRDRCFTLAPQGTCPVNLGSMRAS